MKNSELLDYINNTLIPTRRKFEPNWYRAYHAYENNCYVAYSRVTQSIVKVPYKKRFFVNLPEVKRQCDAFENNMLQFMPLFVPYPDDINDERARETSKYLSKLLKKHYVDWDSKNLIHKYIHLAIKWPISFWEIGVEKRMNPLTNKLQKMIVPNVSDVFDWYYDPHIPFVENDVIVKKVCRSLKNIETFQDYKSPTVDGSTPNDMKEMIFNDKYGMRNAEGKMKEQFYWQTFQRESDGIKEVVLDAEGHTMREKMYAGTTDYPVVPLSLFSNDEYSPSFCENLIPINRSINGVVNRIEEFIHKFSKGAFLVRDGSDISFSDENGVIVKYEGEPPTTMDMPQLPNAIIMWLDKLFDISERYGLNQVAMGLTQTGSQNRSAEQGKMAIQGAQMQQKTPLDNMVQAFMRIANITIYYLSEFTDEPTAFTFRSEGEDFESRKFIGEKYKAKDPTAVVIPKSIKSMEIEIEDVSSSSIYAKRKDLLEIAKEWANIPGIFQEVLLDLYKVGNTAELMDALEKNKSLLDNPEFQRVIEQARAGNVNPEVKKALAIFLDWLSRETPMKAQEEMGVTSNVSAVNKVDAEAAEAQKMPDDFRSQLEGLFGTGEKSKKKAKTETKKPSTSRFANKKTIKGKGKK